MAIRDLVMFIHENLNNPLPEDSQVQIKPVLKSATPYPLNSSRITPYHYLKCPLL